MPTDLFHSLLDALHALDGRLAPDALGARSQLAIVRSLVHEVVAHPKSADAHAIAAQAADELARLGALVQREVA